MTKMLHTSKLLCTICTLYVPTIKLLLDFLDTELNISKVKCKLFFEIPFKIYGKF